MPERLDAQQSLGPTLGQTVRESLPTPDLTDVIYVVKKPDRGATTPPHYGDAHPEPLKYPDHKLVLIVPDGTGTTEVWYYQRLPGSPRVTKSVGTADLTPAKFRRLATTTETKRTVKADTPPGTLTGNETQRRVEYQRGDTAEQTIVEEVIEASTDPLVSYDTDRFKQVVTITEELQDATDPVATPSATVDVQTQALGNGKVIETVRQTTVFTQNEYEKSKPEILPERFRAGIPTLTARNVVAGTAAVPTLGTNDVTKSEKQVTAFTKETSASSRSLGSAPTLRGQDYDESLGLAIPYTEYIAADTTTGANRDVTPIGDGKAVVKEWSLTEYQSALDAYMLTFPGTANLRLPDELIAVRAVMEDHKAEGESSSDNGPTFWLGRGSFTVHPKSSAEGSVALSPKVLPTIRRTDADNVPTEHFMFFLPKTGANTAAILAKVNAISTWPKFRPQSATIVCIGRKLSAKVDADAMRHSGGSESSSEGGTSYGTGLSLQVGLDFEIVHIPPTIHPAIAISGATSATRELAISATATTGAGNATKDYEGSITASVESEGLGATGSVTAVPTSGRYLYQCDVSPYKHNYVRVHAEVVDFANV